MFLRQARLKAYIRRIKMNFTKTKKYVVIALFLVASILSVFSMGKVAVNYNISNYLDDETETKISLGILKEEFGMTGNVQVMIEDIDVQTAKRVKAALSAIENVLTVSFDEYSENSYKEGNALFAVLVDGDEYSKEGTAVVGNIKAALDAEFEGKIHYGGAIVEKAKLRNAIEGEIPFILVISVCLATGIMLLTSKSWLEPLILLAASGVAILLNMGTNALFGEISYITNAVSAILQLALSIDYSIMLLHGYRTRKETEPDLGKAMGGAIVDVVKPVSASALTTIAGLLALLFMSFKIGFDIGIVLMKGIVISAFTSLTLLPAFLLLCDKLMSKTEKPKLVLKGKRFCDFAFKGKKIVTPIAILLIIACAVLQVSNVYTFSDSKNANADILNTFGQNSTVVLLYPHSESNHQNEQILAGKLNAYKTAAGNSVLKSHTAYSNTVRESYDVELASRKLNLPVADVEMLLTMYHLYGEPSLIELNTLDFIKYAEKLLTEDEEAKAFADEGMLKALRMMLHIKQIMNGEHTAEEFHTLVTTGVMEGIEIDLFSVKQMYGLYFYDKIEEKSVNFEEMLDFMISISEKEEIADMFDEKTVENLRTLSQGLVQFRTLLETPLSKSEFRTFISENYGMELDNLTVTLLYATYHKITSGETGQGPISLMNILPFLISEGYITDAAVIDTVNELFEAYENIGKNYSFDQFLPMISEVVKALTGQELVLDTPDLAIQQMYIMYFYEKNLLPAAKVAGLEFVDFILQAIETNPVIGGRLSAEDKAKIEDLCITDDFLKDTVAYDFKEMSDKLAELQGKIQSMAGALAPDSDTMSGIYIKYALGNGLALTEAIEARDLLGFVTEHMDTHKILKAKMTDSNREKVVAAEEAIAGADSLFMSENYCRMLLSVNLPSESEESFRFVEFLTAAVKETFGEGAHVAGEIMSTYDLHAAFGRDNTFITVFTIISIFLIIMIVFRSLSLPIILVAVIQGAIWISMSTSLITGPMFFMSYIVTTCILMGATIDYGILMSTSYVQYRETMDKREALYKAMAAAMPTIFTSGTILTVCGFVIGFIASQNAISTVGILLGKGTLVSMLMITMVLPSLLCLLDGFVIRFTFRRKTEKGSDE